jgi:hypothetical protein
MLPPPGRHCLRLGTGEDTRGESIGRRLRAFSAYASPTPQGKEAHVCSLEGHERNMLDLFGLVPTSSAFSCHRSRVRIRDRRAFLLKEIKDKRNIKDIVYY